MSEFVDKRLDGVVREMLHGRRCDLIQSTHVLKDDSVPSTIQNVNQVPSGHNDVMCHTHPTLCMARHRDEDSLDAGAS